MRIINISGKGLTRIILFIVNRCFFLFKASLFLFLFISIPFLSFCQVRSRSKLLTLPDAVQYTIEHFPTLVYDRDKINAAQYQLAQVKDNRLPNLFLMDQVDDGSNNIVSGDYFTMGIIPSVSAGKFNPGNVAVSGNVGIAYGNWQIYDFGVTHAKANSAKFNISALQSGMTLDQENLKMQVIKYYFQLLKDYSIVSIENSNLTRVTSIKNSIASFVKNGIKPGVDTSLANAELSKARLNLLDAKEQYQLSQLNLKYLTGLDTSLIVPDTSLFQKVNLGLQAVGVTIDTAINANHPLLQFYSSLYDLNTSQLIAYKREFYPQLNLTAATWARSSSITKDGVYQNDFTSGFSPLYSNYLFAVSLSYNLFDIKRNSDKVKEQRMYTDAAYQQYQLQKNIIGTLQSTADVEIKTSLDKLSEIPYQLTAAGKTYSQQLALYNAGLTNIIDVDNALYLLNRALNDKANALNSTWLAILDKAYATYKIDNLIKVF